MANCGKHFPGHGWAEADSHKALPEDERSPETILAEDTEPYAWLGAGLVSVMTAHVLYPQWDTVPATFSRRILQDGLRKRLGFEGLIFSDDLSMQGAKKEGDVVERAQKALAAGRALSGRQPRHLPNAGVVWCRVRRSATERTWRTRRCTGARSLI